MTTKDKIILVLDRQSNNITITQIAKELETTVPKLKEFMKSEGYSYINGAFLRNSQEEQLSLGITPIQSEGIKAKNKQNNEVDTPPIEENLSDEPIEVEKSEMDKFCEMRDWFDNVKDLKYFKKKVNKKTTEVELSDEIFEEGEQRRVTVKINEDISYRLDRLLNNTNQDRDKIINQALYNLLNEYKHLS